MELLAPAGDMERLKAAVYFGADAVYFAGKNFGLRAFSNNFESIVEPVKYCHDHGVKAYVTINVFSRNLDKKELIKYIKEVDKAGADGVIVSDIGIMDLIRETAPNLNIHVSTQANTNSYLTALSYVKHFGATRIVLAREMNYNEVAETCKKLKGKAEVEVFVHGAMCISYSGRCLLSNYMTGRESNRGACAQPCRWNYKLINNDGEEFGFEEDKNGTYILNSKDMCLIDYLDKLDEIGVKSLKIEGRMKSPYYVATITNAYRKALNILEDCKKTGKKYRVPKKLKDEVYKVTHRDYTTGFMFEKNEVDTMNYSAEIHGVKSEFLGVVTKVQNDGFYVEQRNRFKTGECVEILSPDSNFQKKFVVPVMKDLDGNSVDDAKNVQQILFIKSKLKLNAGDILRRPIEE